MKFINPNTEFLNSTEAKRIRIKFGRKMKNFIHHNIEADLDEADIYYNNFRKLVKIFRTDSTYSSLKSSEKHTIIRDIVRIYKLFNDTTELVEAAFIAIENESKFTHHSQFWKIPENIIYKWYDISIANCLSCRVSYLFLAILIIINKNMDRIQSGMLRVSLISNCIQITKFSIKTVTKYIQEIMESDLLVISKDSGSNYLITVPDWFDKYDNNFHVSENELNQGKWNPPLISLEKYDEMKWIGYMWALPFSSYNPFISFIEPNFIIHDQMLTIDVLLFSLFNTKQLTTIHKQWVKRQYRRSISKKYVKTQQYINNVLLSKTVPCNSPHYEQIRQCYPILNFIAKRKRNVNIDTLLDARSALSERTITVRNHLSKIVDTFTIDHEYFWNCFEHNDFYKEWENKYNKELLNPFSSERDDIPVELAEITHDGVEKMVHDAINSYQRLKRQERELSKLNDYIITKNNYNLTSNFNCLEVKTHRITFRNYPIQNISKSNRSVVESATEKLFLIIDLTGAELEILKWFVVQQSDIKIKDLRQLNFDYLSKQLGVNRKTIKSMTYPFLYGASNKTIAKESLQSIDTVKRYKKTIYDFPGVKKFREKAIHYAKQNRISLPTSMGYQFPIWGMPETQGLVYLIQGTGAELLREWILQLRSQSLAKYISNIIHDEIILEISEESVKDILPKVANGLGCAVNKIIPKSEIKAKYVLSKTWNKENGIPCNKLFKVPPNH